MARGGFCKLPNGTVVVALTLPAPMPDGPKEGTVAPGPARATEPGPARPAAPPGSAKGVPRARGATNAQGGDGGTVRVVVHAVNRSRALTRLRNLGLRSVYLRGNTHPPTPDEITAVLHHPDGLIWRTAPLRADELWHPIRSLFKGQGPERRPAADPSYRASPGFSGSGSGVPASLPAYLVPKPLTVPEAWTASGGAL